MLFSLCFFLKDFLDSKNDNKRRGAPSMLSNQTRPGWGGPNGTMQTMGYRVFCCWEICCWEGRTYTTSRLYFMFTVIYPISLGFFWVGAADVWSSGLHLMWSSSVRCAEFSSLRRWPCEGSSPHAPPRAARRRACVLLRCPAMVSKWRSDGCGWGLWSWCLWPHPMLVRLAVRPCMTRRFDIGRL